LERRTTTPQEHGADTQPRAQRGGPAPGGGEPHRSFAPDAMPAPVAAFAEGRIEQARIGRILMVCARDNEIGSHNWEPFARWLVDEVRTVNGVRGALVLDLRRVDRLSSRGLRALSLGWQELAEGRTIAICGLNAIPREVFEIARYDQLFEIHDDSTSAYLAMAAKLRGQA
jgi:anti-anti-sigma regulatory factor